jgi:hypothetical protein
MLANFAVRVEIHFLGKVKGGFGFGLGMVYLESAIILLIIALAVLQIFLYRSHVKVTQQAVGFLDQHLAEVIQTTIEKLPGSIGEGEPINPLAQMFMAHLQSKMEPALQVKEIVRDDDGKFSRENA